MRAPVLATTLWVLCGCSTLAAPDPPPHAPTSAVRWADQGLTADERQWLHHASLGPPAVSLPLAWFFALEQPSLWPGEQPLLSDPNYLRRFGFLVEADDPSRLPVGFAVHEARDDEGTTTRELGLTCAACHTAQLEVDGASYRFDGGPSSVDLAQFERAFALAVLETLYVPGRESRAIERITGGDGSEAEVERLQAQLERLGDQVWARVELRRAHADATEGPGRTDLIGRTANGLFAHPEAAAPRGLGLNAPLRQAALWDTPWFASGPFTQEPADVPLTHATQALGLLVRVETTPDGLSGALDTATLKRLGAALAGPRPPRQAAGFTGLTAPSWPQALFGDIDADAAVEGERLYDQLCMRCHLPPPNREDFFAPAHWSEADAHGVRRLKAPIVDLQTLGTDGAHARRAKTARVQRPDGSEAPAWLATRQQAARMLGRELEVGADAAAGIAGYRARPLDGVWATAPYLHNGSVPTLEALLSPLSERPARFAVGHARFDPVRVGLATAAQPGDRVFDTSRPGNHNSGHLFDEGSAPGILGRRLSPTERHQLVEFLKTLESRRVPVGPGADSHRPHRPIASP